MKDFLGRTIEVGDTIVYPVRRGSSMWLSKGEVEFVGEGELEGRLILKIEKTVWDPIDQKDYLKPARANFYSPERCVVVKDE